MWLYSSQTCTSHFITRPVVMSCAQCDNWQPCQAATGVVQCSRAFGAGDCIASIESDKIIMDIIDRVKRNVNTYRSVDSRLPLMWIALEGDLVSVMAGVRNTGVREKKDCYVSKHKK